MRNASYYMARRENEAWKKDNIERMEAQNTSAEKPRHFQKWMKKIELLVVEPYYLLDSEVFVFSHVYTP
jgi:hypothetical protein